MRKTNYLCAMFAVVVGTYASQNAMATENNGMRTVTKLQQQEILTGVVTDTQGDPIIGATITVVGKDTGAI